MPQSTTFGAAPCSNLSTSFRFGGMARQADGISLQLCLSCKVARTLRQRGIRSILGEWGRQLLSRASLGSLRKNADQGFLSSLWFAVFAERRSVPASRRGQLGEGEVPPLQRRDRGRCDRAEHHAEQ